MKRLMAVMLASGVLACANDSPPTPELFVEPGEAIAEIDHAGKDVIDVAGTKVTDSAVVGQPFRVMATGSQLIVVDASGDPFIHFIDRSGKSIRSFGKRGKGPGEFQYVANLSVDPLGGVWAYDPDLRRMTRIPKEVGDSVRSFSLDPGELILRAVWAGNSVIGVGTEDTAGFVKYSDAGKRVASIKRKFLGADSIPYEQRMKATVTAFSMCGLPASGGFGIAYFFAGRIQLFDSSAVFVRDVASPYLSDVHFIRDEKQKPVIEGNRRWYNDCVATETRIYGLFSGRHSAHFEGEDAGQGRFVHVFDAETGALLRIYRLDRSVFGLTVDEAGNTMYGVSVVDASVVAFPMK